MALRQKLRMEDPFYNPQSVLRYTLHCKQLSNKSRLRF